MRQVKQVISCDSFAKVKAFKVAVPYLVIYLEKKMNIEKERYESCLKPGTVSASPHLRKPVLYSVQLLRHQPTSAE